MGHGTRYTEQDNNSQNWPELHIKFSVTMSMTFYGLISLVHLNGTLHVLKHQFRKWVTSFQMSQCFVYKTLAWVMISEWVCSGNVNSSDTFKRTAYIFHWLDTQLSLWLLEGPCRKQQVCQNSFQTFHRKKQPKWILSSWDNQLTMNNPFFIKKYEKWLWKTHFDTLITSRKIRRWNQWKIFH